MTQQEIRIAILADATAKSLAEGGDDSGVAERLEAILPKVHMPTKLDEELILRRLGAALGDAFLGKLEALAATPTPEGTPLQTKSLVSIAKRTVRLLTERDGVDFGSQNVLTMIDAMPFTAEEKTIIKSLSLQPQVITADQVSAALAGDRPDGKIGGLQ